MSFNLVDLIKDQVTDTVLEKAGGLLGGDDAHKVVSGVESAVPALLGGLTGAANTPGMASVLFDTINKTDDSLLTNFSGALGGSGAGKMIEQGSSVLSGLMGSGTVDKLGSALSSATGMSRGGSGSLMGMLVAPILGVLKKKVVGDGLDAGGLTAMLDGQKANIANAMPANLTSQLGGLDGFPSFAGLTDGVKDAAGNVSAAASGAVGATTAGLGAAAGGVANAAGGAVDSATAGLGAAAGKVGDVAQGGVDAVSGAVGSVANAAGGAVDSAGAGLGAAAGKVGDVAQGGVDAAQNAAGKVGDAAQHGVDTAGKKGGGLFKWLIPLLVLLGLGWLAYSFFGKQDVGVSDTASDAATAVQSTASGAADEVSDAASGAATAVQSAASSAVGEVSDAASGAATAVQSGAVGAAGAVNVEELSGNVSGMFSKATEALSGITDADSATAALPGLKELGGQVSGLSDMFNKVPEVARGPLQGVVSEGLGSLQPMVDKVMAIPGVGSILEPVLKPVMETLDGLGG